MTRRGLAAALGLGLGLGLLVLGCAGAPRAVPEGASPAAPPAERQVMVTFRPAPPPLLARATAELERMYGLRTVYAWTMASLGEQCVVFEVPPGREPRELVRRLSSDPRVGIAQTVETFTTLAETPPAAGAYNDPYAHLQHSARALRLDRAHRRATGRGVRVAVVDTGMDLDHPDLRGRVAKAQNFVDQGEQTFTSDHHGTAVAGVLAASANNQVGIVGVAPGAELYAIKACWHQPPGSREAVCNSYTLARAVDFAIVEGAQVINFSLAGPEDPLLGRLVAAALKRGIVVVAADGGRAARGYPARLEGVIGILGTDLEGGLRLPAGAKPASSLAAPAVDVLTTVPRAAYDFVSGSSLAAAQVAGVAALLLEKEPGLGPARVAEHIRETARPVVGTGNPHVVGQVDACAALARLLGGDCG